ncbi:MAG: molybdenum cofactor guanylyltransferase MobA [Proteobacteria bacterium]|nr:molybdenum cofactor guanylyltransferase MobA [Pseudomonadota bacterium]
MTDTETLPGVILAGGRAQRMGGGDKGRLILGGQPILARVIGRLAPQVGALALNANGDPGRFADLGLPVLPDSVEGFAGPLAGILAGMDWAAGQGARAIVTVAADTPFLPRDLVARLRAGRGDPQVPVIAATPDPAKETLRHPTFGLWPVALRDDLRAALSAGTRKVTQWADAQGARAALFPIAGLDPFFNINTPQDLARAEILLSGGT